MPKDNTPDFGDLLRRFRVAAGLTQEVLAERAGVSTRALSDLERGLHRVPHRDSLRRLAEALSLGGDEHAALMAAARRPLSRQQPASIARVSALPIALTSFVGRVDEIGEVRRLLQTTRLLTLTGAGGMGKTRLALEATADLLSDFPEGMWLVELGSLHESTLVPHALATVLGVRGQPGFPLLDTLAEALGRGRVLVLVDNCEHLLASCAGMVSHLLRACPGLRFLATSRELLRVPGEVVWRVPSLPVPDMDSDGPKIEDVLRSDAVRLFSARASAALPGWSVNEANAADVAMICRQLDGMPLGIELAAAWVRMLSPGEIAARLQDRLRLLVGGSPIQPLRHQTLMAALSWSYDLLGPGEQQLFARLSVFSGGFSLHAVEAVCADAEDRGTVLDGVSRLVDRSLVVAESQNQEAETRYRLLETVCAYGWERLRMRGEGNLMRERHAAWLVGVAEQAERAFHGPQQAHWLRWAEREHDNVRAVLQWALERDDGDTALRLSAALWWSWALHRRWSEARTWFERVLALPAAQVPSAARGKVLIGAGTIASFPGDLATAQARLGECIAIGSDLGAEVLLVARATLAIVEIRAEPAIVHQDATEVLELARSVGYTWGETNCLHALALAAASRADHVQATGYLEEAQQLARATGDTWMLAQLLMAHGDVERSRGKHSQAGRLYTESQGLFAELGLGPDPGLLHNLGYVALAEGDSRRAALTFSHALTLFRSIGDRRGVAECLVGAGCVLASEGQAEEGARFFGAGEAALDRVGRQFWPPNGADYERWLAVARAGVEGATFGRARSEGRSLVPDEVITRVLRVLQALPGQLRATRFPAQYH